MTNLSHHTYQALAGMSTNSVDYSFLYARKYVGHGELTEKTSTSYAAGRNYGAFTEHAETLLDLSGETFANIEQGIGNTWALHIRYFIEPASQQEAYLGSFSTTNVSTREAIINGLQSLLAKPLTETTVYLLEKDPSFGIELLELIKTIRQLLPNRPIWLAYEPYEEDADWVLYVYLCDKKPLQDLKKLDYVYFKYLPQKSLEFNEKIAIVPL